VGPELPALSTTRPRREDSALWDVRLDGRREVFIPRSLSAELLKIAHLKVRVPARLPSSQAAPSQGAHHGLDNSWVIHASDPDFDAWLRSVPLTGHQSATLENSPLHDIQVGSEFVRYFDNPKGFYYIPDVTFLAVRSTA